jgi:SAM-dependent methyltransferase
VPYEAYGADASEGIAAMNRPMFVNQLVEWLGSIPEVDARLRAEPPARVADLACGSAWSSIAIARAYPHVLVDAIDLDDASNQLARGNVQAPGLADRVRPAVQDASDPKLSGRYDLVTIFEALHDMNHPIDALRAARNMLAEGGSVVVGDERVAEQFTAPGDELERFNYGWSVRTAFPSGCSTRIPRGPGR